MIPPTALPSVIAARIVCLKHSRQRSPGWLQEAVGAKVNKGRESSQMEHSVATVVSARPERRTEPGVLPWVNPQKHERSSSRELIFYEVTVTSFAVEVDRFWAVDQ